MKRAFSERRFLGFILFAAAGILLFTFVVMTLWNNILTPVLGVRVINFGQALGILILSKILFGGFWGGGWRGRGRYWSQVPEKWQSMTPEEKEKFKQEWKNRCNRNNKSPYTDNTTSEPS